MHPNGNEEALVHRLRSGEASAFADLVDGLHPRLIAFARTFTHSHALAEDIVQETWLGVIRGLRRFEGRCTLRNWIFSILVRRARTLAARQARRAEVPIPADDPMVDGSAREWVPGRGRVGLWDERLVSWGLEDPASILQTAEAFDVIQRALDALPPHQRQAVQLRDIEDMIPTEICNILGISETNLRVLLHRGRARIRRALDRYLRDDSWRTGHLRDSGLPFTSMTPNGARP